MHGQEFVDLVSRLADAGASALIIKIAVEALSSALSSLSSTTADDKRTTTDDSRRSRDGRTPEQVVIDRRARDRLWHQTRRSAICRTTTNDNQQKESPPTPPYRKIAAAAAGGLPRIEISDEARAFADELSRIAGHAMPPAQWTASQPALRLQLMLNSGWPVTMMREQAIAKMRTARTKPRSVRYFEPIFAEAFAASSLPLASAPVIVVSNTEVSRGRSRPKANSAAAVARRLAEQYRAEENAAAAEALQQGHGG